MVPSRRFDSRSIVILDSHLIEHPMKGKKLPAKLGYIRLRGKEDKKSVK